MKINKLVPFSLAALLTAAGLTGCGNKKPGTELIVWATAEEEQVLNVAVEKFNETAATDDDKIYLTYKAVQEGDAGKDLAKNPSADTAADLVLVADDHVAGLAGNGTIVELDATQSAAVKKDHVANAVKGVTYNDKIYGMPISNDNGYFLYYNSKFVKEDDAKTLEALIAKAKSLNKKVNIDLSNGYYAVAPFVGAGGKLSWSTKSSGVKYDINWDSTELVARSEKLSKLLVDNKNYFAVGDDDFAANGFKDESVIATVRGTWAYENLKSAVGEANLKATKLPTFDGKQMGSFTGSKLYAINASKAGDNGVARRTKALKFAELLTSKEMELVRFEKRNTIPSRTDAQADERYSKHTNITIEALNAQNAAASIVQSQSAEDKYWAVGEVVGKALVSGELGDYNNWQEFLTFECNILR